MFYTLPRFIIAALRGGSGKTILSLGLTTYWRRRGITVAPFKKGPDFIDSGWLSFAADRSCYNLDSFMMSETGILNSLLSHSHEAAISLIEGNRGLFDGLDLEGCCSTAELGRVCKAPVIIIVDVTMTTRTIAALILGCQTFDKELNIAAVILNRVAGSRQETIIRKSIDYYCGLPVLGAIPKLQNNLFPERHMGLVPHVETDEARKALQWAGMIVEDNLNVDEIWRLAHNVDPIDFDGNTQESHEGISCTERPRIGIIRDSSFWFYYPENLDHLKHLGASLVEISAVTDAQLPEVDALYIGGGFPETRADRLSNNAGFMSSLKYAIEMGLPVYAECGGLLYLGESLIVDDRRFPMVGALPIEFVMGKKPQGHGYTILRVDHENPYFAQGEILKGHEFHYSRPILGKSEECYPVFSVLRGHGFDGTFDGLCTRNLLALYTHLHAGGTPLWGKGLFGAALRYQRDRKNNS